MLIQAYTESWVEDFNKIKAVIDETLLPFKFPIEHVGSTAVPHLAAKPIIDIDIIYRENKEFKAIKTGLEKLGYFHNGNQGIVYREVFKRGKLLVFHPVLDKIVHHLYVCLIESEALQRHILFRDYLLENKEARVYYQNFKYEIVAKVNQDKKK